MLKINKGHLAKPVEDIETTPFEEFMTAFYGDKLAKAKFEPQIDFTETPEHPRSQGYFTFWNNVDGDKYRSYIRISKKLAIDIDDPEEMLPELIQNYPIYVSNHDMDGNELERSVLTFAPAEGTRKAKSVKLTLKQLLGKKTVGGVPAK